MERDPLFDLLKHADADTAPQRGSATDLARRVYRRHRRRQVVRTAGVFAVLASVALSGVVLQRLVTPRPASPELVTTQPAETDSTPPTSAPGASQDQIALVALGTAADLHARTADMLTASERRRDAIDRAAEAMSRADPIDVVRQQKNRIALTRVSEADRIADRPGRAGEAMRIYQQTIELFPDTPAADIAARRLENLRT